MLHTVCAGVHPCQCKCNPACRGGALAAPKTDSLTAASWLFVPCVYSGMQITFVRVLGRAVRVCVASASASWHQGRCAVNHLSDHCRVSCVGHVMPGAAPSTQGHVTVLSRRHAHAPLLAFTWRNRCPLPPAQTLPPCHQVRIKAGRQMSHQPLPLPAVLASLNDGDRTAVRLLITHCVRCVW
jgi:hypothetical protein